MSSDSQTTPAVYVASPLGFSEVGRHYHEHVVLPALQERGYRVLDPWSDDHDDMQRLAEARPLSHEYERMAALANINKTLGQRNAALLEQCDAVLALLDGPDVDSGVAAEIGYACALGHPIIGWRSDSRCAGENEATPVNLQVAHFVLRGQGRFASSLLEALDVLAALLPGSPRH